MKPHIINVKLLGSRNKITHISHEGHRGFTRIQPTGSLGSYQLMDTRFISFEHSKTITSDSYKTLSHEFHA